MCTACRPSENWQQVPSTQPFWYLHANVMESNWCPNWWHVTQRSTDRDRDSKSGLKDRDASLGNVRTSWRAVWGGLLWHASVGVKTNLFYATWNTNLHKLWARSLLKLEVWTSTAQGEEMYTDKLWTNALYCIAIIYRILGNGWTKLVWY